MSGRLSVPSFGSRVRVGQAVRFFFAAVITIFAWIPAGGAVWIVFTLKAGAVWLVAFVFELVLDRSITRTPLDLFGYWFNGYQRLSLFVAKGTSGTTANALLGPRYRSIWDFLADCVKVVCLSVIFWGSAAFIWYEVKELLVSL